MRTMVSVLSLALLAACTPVTQPLPAPPPEPAPVARVRTALRQSGGSDALAARPMAVLPVPAPAGATLVVAERGRWWVLPDGRVEPADEYAELLAQELFAPTR